MRAYLLAVLMMTFSLAGCINDQGSNLGGIGDTTQDELALPDWQVGDQWLYTFITPEFGEDSARLVVAEVREDEGLFMLGISSEGEAQRHAVINHNPFLGRVTIDGLSVYENGEPQPVFNFPWSVGNTWNFRLLGQQWSATTDNVYNGEVTVSATSEDGHELDYVFSGRQGFIKNLVWQDSDGNENLRMNLNQKKSGYTGDVYFYRAGDLHDNLYTENDQEIYDTFLDDGYSSDEAWDTLVWYLDVEIDSKGSGSLTISDQQDGSSPLSRAWGNGATEKGSFGTIPSKSGEHRITLTLQGETSVVHLKVAGALVRSWSL
ncbi:MAG TPA: hypothetical protein HA327_06320 [Candidatus Poseidoniaceae archaeon]|mgnify:FL=1|nr:MAG TPA: hypothetical protein D7H81_06245 [Candidatus Poseidoniales archaeon]HII45637.1 hypothetical protein [Candidatus Poseidoniaceae archaeon]|tara:strand:+ start:3307 stop:4263 length:957 start_codon:yes stop_codon:yes gene_type:complete